MDLTRTPKNPEVGELVRILANLNPSRVRPVRRLIDGREYLDLPMSLIVPGVLPGSDGPLLYLNEENDRSAALWNGMPLVVYHPQRNGRHVPASTDGVVEEWGIGVNIATRSNGKLASVGRFDVERTRSVDGKLMKMGVQPLLPRLIAGVPVELSTGLVVDKQPNNQGWTWKGRDFKAIARNYRPDHIAILPDQVGACSINDGCGVSVNKRFCTCNRCVTRNYSPDQPRDESGNSTHNSWEKFDAERAAARAAESTFKAEQASMRAKESSRSKDHEAAMRAHDQAAEDNKQAKAGMAAKGNDRLMHEFGLLEEMHTGKAAHHEREMKNIRGGRGATRNANPEGCNQYKPCDGGGSDRTQQMRDEHVKKLDRIKELSSKIGGEVKKRSDEAVAKTADVVTAFKRNLSVSGSRSGHEAASSAHRAASSSMYDSKGNFLKGHDKKDLRELSNLHHHFMTTHGTASREATGNVRQPSSELDMDPEKACQIVKDGEVHGHPLSEAQQGMFGALCGQRKETKNVSNTWSPAARQAAARSRAAHAASSSAYGSQADRGAQSQGDAHLEAFDAHTDAAEAHEAAASAATDESEASAHRDAAEAHRALADQHRSAAGQGTPGGLPPVPSGGLGGRGGGGKGGGGGRGRGSGGHKGGGGGGMKKGGGGGRKGGGGGGRGRGRTRNAIENAARCPECGKDKDECECDETENAGAQCNAADGQTRHLETGQYQPVRGASTKQVHAHATRGYGNASDAAAKLEGTPTPRGEDGRDLAAVRRIPPIDIDGDEDQPEAATDFGAEGDDHSPKEYDNHVRRSQEATKNFGGISTGYAGGSSMDTMQAPQFAQPQSRPAGPPQPGGAGMAPGGMAPHDASRQAAAATVGTEHADPRGDAMSAMDQSAAGKPKKAAMFHKRAADAHDAAAEDAHAGGDSAGGDAHIDAAAMHRKAAALHLAHSAAESRAHNTQNRDIPQSTRDEMPEKDFAGKGTSFPIQKPGDVRAAASSLGRTDQDRGAIKSRVKSIARRKGFPIPDAWKEEDEGETENRRESIDFNEGIINPGGGGETMNRDQKIAVLNSKCSCEEDRAAFNNFSDETLDALLARNAKAEGSNADARGGGFDQVGGEEDADGSDTSDDYESREAPGLKNPKSLPKATSNMEALLNQYGSEEDREVWRSVMSANRDLKKAEVMKLLVNVRDPRQRNLIGNQLMEKKLPELKQLVSLMGPRPSRNVQHVEVERRPNFLGASAPADFAGAGMAANRENDPADDCMISPTINFKELSEQQRQEAAAKQRMRA